MEEIPSNPQEANLGSRTVEKTESGSQGSNSKETRLDFKDRTEQKITGARSFFTSLGAKIDEDGFVSRDLSKEQLESLRAWNESTTTKPGILMPTEDGFYKKTYLALSLERQVEGGRINYLFGSGIAAEIALRGEVKGRVRRSVEFPYRSHSDFELYAVDPNREAYTQAFKVVFGNQEYFPPTTTKGLRDIPPDLLHSTAETVDLGGVPVRIPELEILFVDKFIHREGKAGTPLRSEGFDAELLAHQYLLDRQKIHFYLDRFFIDPIVAGVRYDAEKETEAQMAGIKSRFTTIKRDMEEAGRGHATQDVAARLNSEVSRMIDIHGESSDTIYSGIRLNAWVPITPEQIDAEGNVTDETLRKQMKEKVKAIIEEKVA